MDWGHTMQPFAATAGVVAQLVEHHNGIECNGLQQFHCDAPPSFSFFQNAFSAIITLGSERVGGPNATDFIRLDTAIEQLLRAKQSAGRRPAYVNSLRSYLAAFARGREHLTVDQITVVDLERWFDERGEPPSSRASNLGRLSALLAWAWRRGLIEENPCKRVERVSVDRTPPQILTVSKAEKLLRSCHAARPRSLPYVVLCLLAGLRPSEARQMTWDRIHLARGIVEVSAAASKVRRRRIVHLMPAAVEWLRVCEGQGLPVSQARWRRCVRWSRGLFGWSAWPQDILRHTCASYLLAEWRDAGRVAFNLGNSPGILMRHYAELVTAEEAEEFWNLRPVNGHQLELL